MKIRKKIQIAFLFYLQNNYLSMAKGSNEFGTSLLSKCYPNGVLPPEIDGEGNIEYKVKKKTKSMSIIPGNILTYFQNHI